MIRHPYVVPGKGVDRQALHAAMHRGVFYGTAGFVDPKAYTLDPWLLVRGTGMSWRAAMAYSMRVAGVTGLALATAGYLGWDPMNVTPGHGYGPGNMPQHGRREFLRSIVA